MTMKVYSEVVPNRRVTCTFVDTLVDIAGDDVLNTDTSRDGALGGVLNCQSFHVFTVPMTHRLHTYFCTS